MFARIQILAKMASNKMWYVEPRITNLLIDFILSVRTLIEYSQPWQAKMSK